MAEYIDKDKFCHYLFKHIATFAENMIQMPVASTLQSVVNEIKEFQSEDVQPVKHGRWIQDEHTYSGCWTYNYVCSACGEIGGSWLRNIRRDQMFPYCPFCGAKMDGEE